MLTKKHFEAVAQILKRNAVCKDRVTTWLNISRELADYFESQNPNFDRNRFYRACSFDDVTY